MNRALITGATAGIGKATAELFAANNIHLILTGRRTNRLTELKEALTKKYGIEVQCLCFDIRNQMEVSAALNTLDDKWKKIDILVNNAGLAMGLGPIQEGEINDWEQMIDTNIKGLLYVTRIVAPWMIAHKKGHIVNISSIAGTQAYPNGNVYCATKHAVVGLTKSMRIDMLPHGIRVTSISPGMVETEFSLVRFHGDEARAKKTYLGLQPLSAEDIADTVWYAVSRKAHVTINDIEITCTAQANTRDAIRLT
ncbi:MAG TPA: SDR family NAD(P)-dependent oxidoreductase [Bacteroidia bacterium]|nr:SDR family NAD(P)-dependent oxidoreductase [Bacteroidia bacterium]HRH07684.1 SDR family NAD(P)-dependent oxidoreductase [Bacteroidia bacterium]HRH64159.1 SDR family NAD(P)-dependent oxidoreductase [Bacteroidia bacterium]